jgi:uncharacterized membrane protein YeaQ/YmgE (transglycosylase-associated protein family)
MIVNTRPRISFVAPEAGRFPAPGVWETPHQQCKLTRGRDHMLGAIILGIVAGYIGRLLMPGRDSMGFIATILLGLAGSVAGFLIFTELLNIGDTEMFDLGGLIGAVIGVMLLLLLYRAVLKNKEHPLAR